MAALEVRGVCPPRFSPVREAFVANFEQGQELGTRFCATLGGEVVLDLMAGWADRAGTRHFGPDTLTPVFSTTKAVTALMMARLVARERLRWDQPVAELWPEFAAAGKARITVEECLSHQDGLAAFVEPIDPALWYDWPGLTARLAAMTPLWPPGTASGYHPATFGYIAGEIFRRADGRTVGAALRQDLAQPLGLDVWIGLPASEDGRVAEVRRPSAMPDLGPMTELKRAAFLQPWSSPGGRDAAQWRRVEIPSANGHATAEALARLMTLALEPSGLDAARERIFGPDLVLPFELSWGAGFLRNAPNMIFGPGEASFGHYGWGGSCAMADPEQGLTAAYVMNRQSAHLIGDPRAVRLLEALYGCL